MVDNAIERCAGLGMSLADVDPIRVEDNELGDLNRLEYPNGGYGFGLANVGDAVLTGNRVSGSEDLLTGFGWAERSDRIGLADNTLIIGGEDASPAIHRWTPVSLSFDRTVTPEHSDRSLAARFTRISLLDADGRAVLTVDVVEGADGLRFGEGVYDVERIDGDGWRWFGGPTDTATFYLFDDDLADASTLEMRGKAIEDGVTATVRADGQRRGEIAFEEGPLRTYRVSLTSS